MDFSTYLLDLEDANIYIDDIIDDDSTFLDNSRITEKIIEKSLFFLKIVLYIKCI